jgi:hypothetical protein
MDYKLLPEYRLENKKNLHTEKRPFYDHFDLIRCENLEAKTKYVYCIDVDKYHNFITHSGVVHNCSPVLQFNPAFRWHFALAEQAAGITYPTSGKQQKAIAAACKNNCPVSPTRGSVKDLVIADTDRALSGSDVATEAQMTKQNQIAANLGIAAIEADLRVQGDPSAWLCTPRSGGGRCVGIVFINPFFLNEGPESGISGSAQGCPVWAAGDAEDPATLSVCNKILTNKGWFVRGADHQIRDGSYITTIKLQLIAPGAEVTQVGMDGFATKLGAWEKGATLPGAGQQANTCNTIVGNSGTGWGTCVDSQGGCVKWVGLGEADWFFINSLDPSITCDEL